MATRTAMLVAVSKPDARSALTDMLRAERHTFPSDCASASGCRPRYHRAARALAATSSTTSSSHGRQH